MTQLFYNLTKMRTEERQHGRHSLAEMKENRRGGEDEKSSPPRPHIRELGESRFCRYEPYGVSRIHAPEASTW